MKCFCYKIFQIYFDPEVFGSSKPSPLWYAAYATVVADLLD